MAQMIGVLFTSSQDFKTEIPKSLKGLVEFPLVIDRKEYNPDEIKNLKPDFLFVIYYGKIIEKEILEAPSRAAINIHFSILPKYRGPAPVEWAVFNNEKKTGITLAFIEEKVDAGDIIDCREFEIFPGEKASELFSRLAKFAPGFTRETIEKFIAGKITPRPQEGEPSWARILKKSDGFVNFEKEEASVIERKIRAFSSKIPIFTNLLGEHVVIKEASVVEEKISPGCFRLVKNRGIIVGCLSGALLLEEIQPAGKKEMSAWSFAIGREKQFKEFRQ